VLGLAFKPDTDDMRDAPSITIIEDLVARGARVHATDPAALDNARAIFGDRVTLFEDPYEAIRGSDCLALVTEWQAYRELDLDRVLELMSHPTVVDGRNLFDPGAMQARGFTYRSFGR
jgi:UDPglucose 6-dehydrogenase